MAISDTDWRVEKNYKTANTTVADDFVAAQKERLQSSKQRINDAEKRNYQQFKQTQGGQAIRNTFATGSRKLRRVSDRSNNKIVRKGARYAATKLKVTSINTWVGGWVIFWYLTFQLPFALISTAGLGMAASVYSILDSIEEVTGIDGTAFLINGSTFEALNKVIAAAGALFGINFNPLLLFIIPFALIFLLTLFQLVLIWFTYSLSGIRSLTGKKSGVKNTTFLIAGVGSVIPILNLFPLIFLWMIVVWKWPK